MEQIETAKTSDELDDLLSEYNNNLTEIPEENEQQEETNTATERSNNVSTDSNDKRPISENTSEPVSESVWRNNPLYYQTGQKQGQLRPTAKKQAEKNAPPKEVMEISGTLIDGALFIMLIDLLFPLAITFLNNKASKAKIKVEDLQLTEKQKRDLQPVSDEVVKYLMLRANPIWLMAIAMTGIYGINFMAAKSAAEAKLERDEK